MNSRQRLLRAALDVYASHGSRGATTRRIADAAGVNEVTLFRQFGSKNALLAEALASIAADEPATALPDFPTDPSAEIARWVRERLERMRARRRIIRREFADPGANRGRSTGPADDLAGLVRELEGYARRAASTGAFSPARDVQAAAVMTAAALFTDATLRDFAPDAFPPEADAPRRYAAVFLELLGAGPATAGGQAKAAPPPFDPDATGA